MGNSNYNDLDKNKIYCYGCFRNGVITELPIHSSNEYCLPCKDHNTRSKFRLQYDEKYEKFMTFRGLTFGNRPQSEINAEIYQIQKENGTGWCSKEAIMKRNSSEHNSVRQQNAAKRGNKMKSVKTQIERGLHPSQNKDLQAKKILIMRLHKIGITNIKVSDLSPKLYQEILNKLEERFEKYCQKCGKLTLHNGFVCLTCKPSSIGVSTQEWRLFDNKIDCNSSCKFIEKCELIQIKPLKNKWGYCKYAIDKIGGKEPYFIKRDNLLYYLDKEINDYVLWENFKKKFSLKNKNIDDFTIELKNKYPNLLIIPTFRSQESVDWTGARSAFEQNLVDKGIKWFTYIKFYIDKQNNVKPLVVGKSGSLLVNSVGSDVSFSEDENHGPARKFLLDNKLEWDKTQILVIPCNNESEALENESIIQERYNLFSS